MRGQKVQIPSKIKIREYLNADALLVSLKRSFNKIPDHRPGDVDISLSDAIMSGFAMFSIKDPSLLAFDNRRKEGNHNLNTIYNIAIIPSDTRMREISDELSPKFIRSAYKVIFRALQRGKALEPMVFMEGCYLLSLDGTGYYYSEKIGSDYCLRKKEKKTGKVTYYRQMLGASIVHPDFKEVIPLAPEMIIKQEGESKNDCERNAAKRFFDKLRKDLLVNFIEYWEVSDKETKHFSWVTDFTVTNENAYKLMRGGRARWKTENETFNTLKN